MTAEISKNDEKNTVIVVTGRERRVMEDALRAYAMTQATSMWEVSDKTLADVMRLTLEATR